MNFSVALVGLVTLLFLGIRYLRAEQKRTGVSLEECLKRISARLENYSSEWFASLLLTMIICIVVSLVSFRQLWSNDVFNVVFISTLLRPHIRRAIDVVF